MNRAEDADATGTVPGNAGATFLWQTDGKRVPTALQKAIESAWQRRATSTSFVRIEWAPVRDAKTVGMTFRSSLVADRRLTGRDAADGSVDRCVLELGGASAWYQSAWWFARSRISRREGIVGETPIRVFFQALESHFTESSLERQMPLMWEMRLTEDARIDVVWSVQTELALTSIRSGGTCGGTPFDDEEHPNRLEELFWRAAVLAFRPFWEIARNGAEGHVRERWAFENSDTIGSTRCAVVAIPWQRANRSGVRRYWLDIDRQFVVVRAETFEEKRLLDRTIIDYRDTGAHGWVPRSWDVRWIPRPAATTSARAFPGNARLPQRARAHVLSCRFDTSDSAIARLCLKSVVRRSASSHFWRFSRHGVPCHTQKLSLETKPSNTNVVRPENVMTNTDSPATCADETDIHKPTRREASSGCNFADIIGAFRQRRGLETVIVYTREGNVWWKQTRHGREALSADEIFHVTTVGIPWPTTDAGNRLVLGIGVGVSVLFGFWFRRRRRPVGNVRSS